MSDVEDIRADLRDLAGTATGTAEAYPAELRRARRIRARRVLAAGLGAAVAIGAAVTVTWAVARGPDGGSVASPVVRTLGCGANNRVTPDTPGPTPFPANQESLNELLNRIGDGGQQRFADVYTGVELDLPADLVRVYRRPSPAFDAWVTGQAGPQCVEIVGAAHSRRELEALRDRVFGDADALRAAGVRFASIAITEDGHLELHTQDIEAGRREIAARYGPDAPIVVAPGGPGVFSEGATTAPSGVAPTR
ncbi:hypothetical protein [Dactylosporangium sp. CA-139066]|uniref:hypothetical protein n=1 Tax=Dactylosporangium sp. CA-139066 TaxID=3239930 RepID=UPI003D8EF752